MNTVLFLLSWTPIVLLTVLAVFLRRSAHATRQGDVHLRIGPSAHPMADHLPATGLNQAQPLAMRISIRFASRLNQGAPLASKDNDNL